MVERKDESSAFERDVVFERACDAESRSDARLSDADRMLSAMVIFDSVCVHDGVLPALDCHAPEELAHALAGFRHFGLPSVADVIESIAERAARPTAIEQDRSVLEGELESAYAAACPDTAVDAAFTAAFDREPNVFTRPSAADLTEHRDAVEFIRRL